MQMECYGRSFNRREQCSQCELRDYCRDAGDIPLLNEGKDDEERLLRVPAPPAASSQTTREKPKFSRNDVIHVARIILSLDAPEIIVLLRMKLENPDISLSQIGDQFGITKQGVYKTIARYCSIYPFLSCILQNRPLYNRWRQGKRQFDRNYLPRGGKMREEIIRQGLYKPPMIQPELELFPEAAAGNAEKNQFFQPGQ